MGVADASVKIVIDADSTGAEKQLQSASSAVDKFTEASRKQLQSLGKTLAGVGQKMSLMVTGPILAMGAGFIKLASDAEETQSKFDNVFGHVAEAANQWAEQFAASVGRSRNDIKAWMAALQDTFVPLGFTREQAAEFSKQLAQLTVDLSSFNNVAEADALRDLQSALVGNHETMRKYGVIITQAALEQAAYDMGIQKAVTDMTEQEKVLVRLHMIMQGTTDAQGDATRTAGSFANQMRALTADIKDLGAELGQMLLPIAQAVIGAFRTGLQIFGALPEPIQRLALVAGALLAAIGPIVLVVGKAITAFTSLSSTLGTLGPAVGPLISVLQGSLIPMLATTGPLVLGIGAVVAAGYLLIKNWDTIVETARATWRGLQIIWEKITGYLESAIQRVKEFFADLVKPITDIVGTVTRVFDSIKEKVSGFLNWLPGRAKKAGAETTRAMEEGLEARSPTRIERMFMAMEEQARSSMAAIGRTVEGFSSQLRNVGSNLQPIQPVPAMALAGNAGTAVGREAGRTEPRIIIEGDLHLHANISRLEELADIQKISDRIREIWGREAARTRTVTGRRQF